MHAKEFDREHKSTSIPIVARGNSIYFGISHLPPLPNSPLLHQGRQLQCNTKGKEGLFAPAQAGSRLDRCSFDPQIKQNVPEACHHPVDALQEALQ